MSREVCETVTSLVVVSKEVLATAHTLRRASELGEGPARMQFLTRQLLEELGRCRSVTAQCPFDGEVQLGPMGWVCPICGTEHEGPDGKDG